MATSSLPLGTTFADQLEILQIQLCAAAHIVLGIVLPLVYALKNKPFAPFSLEDQHGVIHAVDDATRVILFSREMKGGNTLKQALADAGEGFLGSRAAVYIADISGMPRLIARIFAIPRMRERPYAVLLDRDGTATARLPDVEGSATLIFVEGLTIQRIEHLETPAGVLDALEP